LAQEILKEITIAAAPRGITVETTPLRRVMLPPGLSQSIESKLQAEQESQRIEFILTKEKKKQIGKGSKPRSKANRAIN
jgi:prohibitin 1